jgi:tetratricopeptide (TPR) repeat protein
MVMLFAISFSQLRSQNRDVDSLRQLLASATHDTTRVYLYTRLGLYAQTFESGLEYANKAMTLAQKIGYRKGIAMALNGMGNEYSQRNYSRALDYYFKALQIREETGDLLGQSATNGNIGLVYQALGDYPKALSYFKLAIHLAAPLNVPYNNALTNGNMGDIYMKLQKPDSALFYYSRAFEHFQTSPSKYQMAASLNGLGNVQNKLKNREVSIGYYRMALANGRDYNDTAAMAETCLGLATVFRDNLLNDSAIFYARQSLLFAQQEQLHVVVVDAAKLLADLYHDKNETEAYRFLRIAMISKDTAFSKDKQVQIESMSFAEQERQNENERRSAAAAAMRQDNLQYAGIALVLVCFIIGFFVFSHSIIANQKLIRFLGIIALLIVFEFLNLLLHPWLMAITGHSPVLMLLVMVCIAALLIPLHHRLEHWITHRLVEKNKKIRLTAAKKTIAALEN